MMAEYANRLRMRWAAFDPNARRRYATVAVLAAVVGTIGACLWLRAEHTRLQLREDAAIGQLKELRDHLAEVERLKGQPAPIPLKGPALQATVVASLQSRGLPLTVAAVDAERLRIYGDADFDEVMRWLGSVQQSQRLGLVSLTATRQDAVAKLELILTAARE
jgi:type II secretory pathway component PulM